MEAKPTASIEQSISQYYTLVFFVIVFPIFSIVTYEQVLCLYVFFLKKYFLISYPRSRHTKYQIKNNCALSNHTTYTRSTRTTHMMDDDVRNREQSTKSSMWCKRVPASYSVCLMCFVP